MGVINLNFDDKTKDRLEKIAKKKGYNTINEFIMRTIERELSNEEEIEDLKKLEPKTEDEIITTLVTLSERLSDMKDHEEKIQFLVTFDNFLKKHEQMIKEKCPDLLVSVLSSL